MLKLRKYQSDCRDAILKAHRNGINRQLISMPTASGKTVCFSNLPKDILKTGKSIWMLAHRDELIEQSVKHFKSANPNLKIGIEKADEYADTDCDIIVSSVQSIGKTGEGFTKRLQRFKPSVLSTLIIDECHHAAGESYKNVLKYFGVLKGEVDEDKTKLLLGYTATPTRGSGEGLSDIFDEIVFSRDIREFIRDGWLADIRAHRVETQIDLSGVKTVRGDFAQTELQRRVNTPERNSLIVKKYIEMGDGKPAIAFVVDVQMAHDLALEFRKEGISSLPVSGQTPDNERARILAAHRSGEIKVVCNCGVFTEGTDLPWAEIGILARPTKSSLLFTQMIGRILRPYPSPEEVALGAAMIKQFATIIDFVDNSMKHQLCTVPTLFGLSSKFNAKGESITEALAEVEDAQEKFKQLRLDSIHDLKNLHTLMQTIDLLRPPAVPQELQSLSNMAWVMSPNGYQLIGQSFHFSVRQNQLGQYELARHAAGMRQVAAKYTDLKQAVAAADGLVPVTERNLVNSNAKWRNGSPTPKQIKMLAGLDKALYGKFGRDMTRFSDFVSTNWSRGDVSSMISEKMRGRTPWVKK